MASRKKTIDPADGLSGELQKRTVFDDPRQEAYLNLARTHSLLAGAFAKLFREHGISDPQYNALRILRGQGKPMHIHQIAERMVAEQTDISRLIVRLDKAGWVKRDPCAQDRRVVWIDLTPKGRALLKKLERPVERLHQSQFQQLTKKELGILNELLFKARQ
jgi:DNA-binding MarR family transcriptional regulator